MVCSLRFTLTDYWIQVLCDMKNYADLGWCYNFFNLHNILLVM